MVSPDIDTKKCSILLNQLYQCCEEEQQVGQIWLPCCKPDQVHHQLALRVLNDTFWRPSSSAAEKLLYHAITYLWK